MISLLQEAATTVVEQSQGAAAASEHGGATAQAAAAAGEASAPGMPQLNFDTFPNQIFWLAISLVVLYWVLSKIALPRIAAVISDRQGAITGDLMAAEEFKQRAKDAEAAYDKALAEARGEAGKIVAANRAEIQKELDAAIAHADAEIAARVSESEKRIREIRDSAQADARQVAREVTAQLVETFGGQVDQGAVDQAVDNRMERALQ
ncbi:MAG: F0F1 ATP synthase subunit B' [Paracoccus sp. (in: a-proteobacteria)]|uniref:F0F1 ATP synthase subunit B' n=2 Tax=Paracoccus TaxID=265 RepID=UPI000C64AF5E|nr:MULTISPECIES: F0F1 ATP synthase subunit B' [unclassified Paracoccus (in: a-proteobacteria)]MBA49014.1 F0F1 ATP synthase subunit B' [Paracoccus sp. (in: a-proteobacteria)]MDB2552370.1 F0F1 ATP synthase subunit B' [Paracoccus sp. (in: a-proteobacteria)]HIC65958.1 F0F1 ATP synthase subunit B' [Paracoccus sp. (in: a-proteobacteria)]|tara:strand:- start:4086 stop:4706 length:621 start_codon:yes stop_codon:yes gene_type:complete